MKVSIIVPVYNCEKYLKKCIESIINQTYKDLELILIDDGSTDKSYDISLEYKKKYGNIIVLKQNNKGSGSARNYGIEKATGKYLMFCDSDDFFCKNTVESFIKETLKEDYDLVISGYNNFKYYNDKVVICKENNAMEDIIKTKEQVRKSYIELHEKCLNQAPWGKLYKRSIVIENKVRFKDYKRCQDIIFNLQYYEHVESIKIIKDKLYNYQTPEGNAYISKFPSNMIEIRKEIDRIITETLKKWNVYDEKTEKYLNKILVTDILVCIRLNYLNNWNFNKEKKREYINNLLKDEKVIKVLKEKGYGKKKDILCTIVNTKNYFFIEATNFFIALLQNISLKVNKYKTKRLVHS